MEKKVSIIIPCYNVEKYLKDCFKCLDNLDYKNVEIIFVNDGSKDNTLNLLNEYVNNNPKSKIINKTNGGLSTARNAGIDMATGDYLYFYDPDDILNKEIITNLVNLIENNDADFSITYCKKVSDKANFAKLMNKKEKGSKVKVLDDNQEVFISLVNNYSIFTSVWNKLYKTDIIKNNSLRFDENCFFGEDTPFNYYYIGLTHKTAISNKVQYYYVQRKTSIVHQAFKEKRLTIFPLYNRIIESEENKMIPYLHMMRLYNTVECLYFIKKSEYDNGEEINKLLNYAKQDIKFIKLCKHIKLYRRLLLPLVPPLGKFLLRKRLKNKGEKI